MAFSTSPSQQTNQNDEEKPQYNPIPVGDLGEIILERGNQEQINLFFSTRSSRHADEIKKLRITNRKLVKSNERLQQTVEIQNVKLQSLLDQYNVLASRVSTLERDSKYYVRERHLAGFFPGDFGGFNRTKEPEFVPLKSLFTFPEGDEHPQSLNDFKNKPL